MIFPKINDVPLYYGAASENNLVLLTRESLPFHFYYGNSVVKGIRVHKKLEGSFRWVCSELWKVYKTQVAIDAAHVSRFSGCYNPRVVRGGATKSLHAYGAAMDFDAENNPMSYKKEAGFFKSTSMIVLIFKEAGWFWGGDFKGRKDPMHFEAVTR